MHASGINRALMQSRPLSARVRWKEARTKCSRTRFIHVVTTSFKGDFTSHFSAQNFSDLIPVHSGLVLACAVRRELTVKQIREASMLECPHCHEWVDRIAIVLES